MTRQVKLVNIARLRTCIWHFQEELAELNAISRFMLQIVLLCVPSTPGTAYAKFVTV